MKGKILGLVCAASIILSGCNSNNSNGKIEPDDNNRDTVRIGVVTPQTGPVSVYGKSNEEGIRLATDKINEDGGIDGKKIELIVMDDKGEITEAVNSFNKLVEDDVDLVIGAFTSKPSLALAETAQNTTIPVITPGGTQEEITMGKKNVFRLTFTNSYQAKLLSIFANDTLKAKTAAILKNGSDDYSTGIAEDFKKSAEELGIKIVADETYGENDTDFKAQLTNIKNTNPDVLLLPDYYEKLSLIMPQTREVGIKSTLIGPDGRSGILSALDKSIYKELDGSYYNDHFSIDDKDEKVKDFVENYKKTYNAIPISPAALGYDSMYLAKEAIEKAGTLDDEAIIDALKNIDFRGVTGSFKFDENNNPIKSSSIIEIKDGKYIFNSIVEPR